MFDRSTKLLAAIFILVTAILLAMNLIAQDAPLKDWWFTLFLFFISFALWLSVQFEDMGTSDDENVTVVKKAKAAVDKAKEAIVGAKGKASAKQEVAKKTEQKTPPPPPEKQETKPVEKAPEPAQPEEIDDLTRIEGVGPKYRDALLAAGITTFAQVAEAKQEELETAVKAGGMRRTKSMATWAEQAGYAVRDDWAGLDELQKKLKGGKR